MGNIGMFCIGLLKEIVVFRDKMKWGVGWGYWYKLKDVVVWIREVDSDGGAVIRSWLVDLFGCGIKEKDKKK